MAAILQGGVRDTLQRVNDTTVTTKFAVTDFTEDFSISCNGLVTEIGDGLGTLIRELIKKGVIDGTVSA